MWAAGPNRDAEAEDSLSGTLTEQAHTIEVTPGLELTTLEVTRTFFNPTFSHEQLGVTIDVPCDAILDGLELRGRDDARGRATWVPGKLIDPGAASDRFTDHRFSPGGAAIEGDVLAVLSRAAGCTAELDLFPVPPLRERSVRYRIQVPSQYSEGRYRVELPSFQLDQRGAQLSVVDPASVGFEVAVDGLPLGPDRQLSGLTPHTITLSPVDAGRARTSLAAIDLRKLGASDNDQSLVAAELDLPTRLVDLPPVRRVVVVVDASHSLDDRHRQPMQELAAAYLDALVVAQPHARVEILEFDREVRRVHGEFVEPGQASERLRTTTFATRNGSEPGLALTHARELLAAAHSSDDSPGVDWLVLLGDLELRDGYPLATELELAEAHDVRMHVITPGGSRSLTPMPADDPWMAIAQAAGGAHFGYQAAEDSLARDGAELLEPNRVWDLRLNHTDARGRSTQVELEDELAAGESTRWIDRLAAPALDRVAFEAFSWASPLTWSAKSSSTAQQRWAGLLTTGGNAAIELDEIESKALAELAQVVSPWTSQIAEARFDGNAPTGERWGCGGSWFGHGGSRCGISCGIGSAKVPGIHLDLSVLRATIEQAIGECHESTPGSLSFEILDREIVAVESSRACVREAIWSLDLRAWPYFGHPIVQVAFDGSGVLNLQLAALEGDQAASHDGRSDG